jgi:hypothetical protein
MADQLAAAAMMAGHPNEVSPLGLRNIGFTLHMGGDDAAYGRNEIAAQWKEKLAKLHQDDPGGYRHLVEIYPGKGHWMERLDASAVEWVRDFVRDPVPEKIVWKQDDEATHRQFYWLAVDQEHEKSDATVIATRDSQTVDIVSSDVNELTVCFDDRMADLDTPVRVTSAGKTLFDGKLNRRIATMAKNLNERGDPEYLFPAEVTVELEE